MRLGVLLPHRAVVLQSARRPPLETCWTVARMCDEAGLDLWVGDSIVAKPRLEPLTTLAYLAALTQRARLGWRSAAAGTAPADGTGACPREH